MSGLPENNQSSEMLDTSGRALKLQTDTPHLVSIGGDRLSTSVTLHPIPQGRVTLGSGPGVDILVHGTGVLPLHCHIENSEGVVTIYPLSDNLSIDGVKIYRPTRLSQGVMLTIGRSNYMRFNHPVEAKIMKSVLPNPRISVAPINFEPENLFQPKFNKKPPAVPKRNSKESLIESGVEEPVPSSIMTKVSKFEYLAQQNFKQSISPKVFSSNIVTVNTPALNVIGKSRPDIETYTKNLPQNALNYSELNSNEKDQVKTPDRTIFGKKSPQYVNVALNDAKNINNKVIIYENGCISKNQNVNLDHNELNNKTSSSNKDININRGNTPSPGYNRNPPYFRSMTPSPVSNSLKFDHRRSGSLGELTGGLDSLESLSQRSNDAEIRRTQAQQERINEQEIEKQEQVRLEEILNMCVEYEIQAQCEKNKVVTPNRIKTNGSLPRDKRQCGPLSPVHTTPPSSPGNVNMFFPEGKQNNHSYENVTITKLNPSQERMHSDYENVEIGFESDYRRPKCGSPYENVHLQQNAANVPSHSPRTRIKTMLTSNRENKARDTTEIIENKFAFLESEQYLLQSNTKKNCEFKKGSSTKFIFPLEDTVSFIPEGDSGTMPSDKMKSKSLPASKLSLKDIEEDEYKNIEILKKRRKVTLSEISAIKQKLAENETHEDELQRDLELEYALISGEQQSKLLELNKLENRKEKLVKYAQSIEEHMLYGQEKQEKDQKQCKTKLEIAQQYTNDIEKKLVETPKADALYEQVFEEYLKASDVLDNERKNFEDLEFHHLEEEANWLASREEVQREIVELSKKIDVVDKQNQELDQQKSKISKTNNLELKTLKKHRFEYLMELDKITNKLKDIEYKLAKFSIQDSEQEDSTDSDSDKSKELEKQLSNLSLNMIHDLSYSVIVSNTRTPIDHVHNMSQSFNEKLLHEKSILEGTITTKYPSQDDIDRISKVTSNAPINIGEEQGSLGRRVIESLKDIERKRQLHLHQQGSQVIEQERKKVLALKQRVQQEVKSEWAQRRQDLADSMGPGDTNNSNDPAERKLEKSPTNSPTQNDLIRSGSDDGADSPRPMSEISEMSVETGTLSKRRSKTPTDKQRPLTRYLPIRGSDLDLRQHIESAGHQVVLCPHVIINSSSCRGFLHKKGSKLNGWSKRWFVFDRNKHTFTYYNDKSEKKARGGAYFQAIEEVYLDHLNNVKSPNPQLTFIVKTHERFYYLLAPSPEAMRIWVDVIFTGAEGYQEFEHGT